MGLLYLDRGDSAIFAALKDAGHNNRQAPGSPTGKFSHPSDSSDQSIDGRIRHDIPAGHGPQQWVVPADKNGIKFNPLRPKSENPLDSLSPTSDNTLFEEPEVYSLDRSKDEENFHDYFSLNGTEKDEVIRTEPRDPALSQKRRVRHSRALSSVSFNAPERASLPIRARTKTDEGLLQLHMRPESPKAADSADAPKTPRNSLPADRHRRKVSLGLPLRGISITPESLKHPSFDPRCTLDTPPQTPAHDRATTAALKQKERDLASAALKQKERDLEYKHRHTFIGTASLDDFLEVLDVSNAYTTTKAAVARAFIILASSERLLARQASSTPSGWELVSRKTSDLSNIDYVAQAHIRLGSITLRQFLDLIYFDEEEEVGAMSVIEAFSAASHLDAKVDGGTGSRARAFRSWMAKQSEVRR
ncbi:Nn.00g045380.m01.CDS01 [Neocucurbitaria sp. VM-36]